MSEATIPLTDPEEIRTLFGVRDEHLRRLRDSVGVDVVLRGDTLKLQGSSDQVDRGLAVIGVLRAVIDRDGELSTAEVVRALGDSGDMPPAAASPVSSAPSASSRPSAHVDQPIEASPRDSQRIELYDVSKVVRPQTKGQAGYVEAIRQHDLVFCTGPAGCGKTYLSVAMALSALRSEDVRKIVLVRPAVEAGEKLGFLPGDLLAKVNPYLRPLLDALAEILNYDQLRRYMEHDVIEVVPLAFMRGRTLNETFIILDEGQNTTRTQMKMFLTRMGQGSRIVVTGDTTQVDLPEGVTSGLTDAVARLEGLEGVAAVTLGKRDIVRHRLVGEIVQAYERD